MYTVVVYCFLCMYTPEAVDYQKRANISILLQQTLMGSLLPLHVYFRIGGTAQSSFIVSRCKLLALPLVYAHLHFILSFNAAVFAECTAGALRLLGP